MTEHLCQPPVDPWDDDPDEWTCTCGRVWEKRIEDEADFYNSWYQPSED